MTIRKGDGAAGWASRKTIIFVTRRADSCCLGATNVQNILNSHCNTLILKEIQQKEAYLSFYLRCLEGENREMI